MQAEDALRHQIGVDLDPSLRNLPIVAYRAAPTPVPPNPWSWTKKHEVHKALAMNPAEKQAVEKIAYDDLGVQSARNGLLPNLVFSAAYSSQGQGGIFYPSSSTILANGTVAPPDSRRRGGRALADVRFRLPHLPGGAQPDPPHPLPIRFRRPGHAVVQKKLDALAERNQQQNIRLQVLTDVTAVEGAKEQLKLSIVERDFAKLNLDAENQKYQLGTETNQNVILAQQTLASAELNVVNNQIALRKSILNLHTQTGELLDARGIVIP